MSRFILLSSLACTIWFAGAAQKFHYVPQDFSNIGYSTSLANPSKPSTYNDTLPTAIYDQWGDYVTYKNGALSGTGSNGYWQGSYEFKSIQDLVRIGVVHNTLAVPVYNYKITLSILKYSYSNPNTPSAVIPVDLTVSYNPDSLKQYEDLAIYKFSDCLKFDVVVTGIYDLNATGVPLVTRANLAQNFFIEPIVKAQRYVSYAVFPVPECSATTNALHVAWECTPFQYYFCKKSQLSTGDKIEVATANYELEWCYIDDYKSDLSTTPPTNSYQFNSSSTIPYDFRHNSTRIITNNLSYDIPLLYEHGAIVFRIRAFLPQSDSGYKDGKYFDWNLEDNGTIYAGSSCFPGHGFLITNPHSGDSLNWQYSIQFAEQGKYKHVINYFDGALKGRQTQTKVNTNSNYVVAVDKAYDYEGRPVLQTLPIPILQNSLSYRSDLALNSSTGKAYRPSDLDKSSTGTCAMPDSLSPVSTYSAASKYYSTLNTDTQGMQKFVPDAQGYPFVQSIYSPDNTNKILWQGGAGKDFQLWKDHATRNEYVKAIQPELDVVLGTEAGYAAFYPKQVTTDPNGQTSFSIFNPGGKIVMTGLLGIADTAHKPIDLLPEYAAGATLCTDLLRGSPQHKDIDELSVSVPYYSDIQGNPTKLTYSASIPACPIGCSKYLWTKGIYTISITDDCGVPVCSKTDSLGKDSVLSANIAQSTHGDSIVNTLAKGRYTVSKKLEFSPYAIKDQVKAFVASNEPVCFYDEKHFVRTAVEASSFPCTTPYIDPCEGKRQAMMKELWPGAKYGQYFRSADGQFNSGANNSIFSKSPVGTMVYSTSVDDSGNSLISANNPFTYAGIPYWSDSDWHWLTSADSLTWRNAFTYTHPYNPYGETEVDKSNWYGPNQAWYKTNIYLTARDIDSLQMLVIGDGNDSVAGGVPYGDNSRLTCDVAINSVYYNLPYKSWFHLPNLTIGWNEIKVSWWNCCGLSGFGAYFSHFTLAPQHYRYQASCLTLPTPIIYKGVTYTSLDSIPPQVLIETFSDSLAELLLPLHPEYCKLALCNEGDFTDQLEATTSFQEADAANRFKLDSIIAHDPIYVNADPGAKAQTKYDLSHIRNYRRIDSLSIEIAYCNAGNGEESQHCVSYLYPTEIASISFANDAVKQSFFTSQKQLYLANRGLILQKIYDGSNDTCPTCATARMQLIPNPVFPKLFNAGGTVDTSLHLPGWIASAFNNALNNDTTGVSNAVAHSQDSLDTFSSALCQIQIYETIRDLANCTTDTVSFPASLSSTHPLAIIRKFLSDRCASGNGNDYTPATIDSALSAAATAGLVKSDLCHPFLVKYGVCAPKPSNNFFQYACGDSDLYEGLRQFLNRSDVRNAIRTATSFTGGAVATGLTLNTANAFESRLATLIGGTGYTIQGFDQTVPANTTGATEYVKLSIKGHGGSAFVYLRSKDRLCPLQLNGQSSINFNTCSCINSDFQSGGQGAISQNTALVNVSVSGTPYDFYVWTPDVPLMTPSDASSIAGSVTCMDLKRTMQQFYADSATYHFDATFNHPLYQSTLTNYLNYKLQKHFTYADYADLMNGCAISDQLQVKRYLTTYQISFNSDANAAAFIASLDNVGANTLPDYFVYAASGTTYCWLNLGSVASSDVLRYKNYIDNYSGSGVTSRSYLLAGSADYLFVPDSICTGFTTSSISGTYGTLAAGSSVTVGLSGANGNYTKYTFTPAGGSAAKDYADDAQAIKAAILAQCPSIEHYPVQELLRSTDYLSTPKQDYLSYVYSQTSHAHDAIIADIAPDMLKSHLSSFSGKTVMYDDPLCQNKKRDVYLFSDVQSSYPGFVRTQAMLTVPTYLFPSSNTTVVNSSTSVYRKANGVYWYRQFDSLNNLYNVYLIPPQHSVLPLNHYAFDYIHVAGGGDSSHFFTAYVHDPSAPSILIPCKGYADFTVGYSQKVSNVVLLGGNVDDICIDTSDCERYLLQVARNNGTQAYRHYNDSTVRVLSDSMIRYVVNHTVDTLELCSGAQKYHYTLYYYDRAGNLVRTVPPAGVQATTQPVASIPNGRENVDTTVTRQSLTQHKKISTYKYNAENKLIYQKTPDGGSTFLFYNSLGNLSFSQTTKQRVNGYYTYVLHDGQERPVETGQVQLGCVFANPTSIDLDTARCVFSAAYGFGSSYGLHPKFIDSSSHYSITQDMLYSIIRSLPRTDVVVTTYDTALRLLDTITGQHLSRQENLLHRVSAIQYFATINPNYPNIADGGVPKFTTYYSYDLDGNVSTVSYDYLPLANTGQRYKRVDYDYDLASGKVNSISCNRGRPDQFYQRYEYDADNRITEAWSSNDGLIWNKDARYSYYLHGPLAQVQIGDAQIQSLEYAYTINGWLKAINSDVLRPDLDMGKNGVSGDQTYACDVISHTLSYYDGDYKPIAQTPVTHLAGPAKGLYNGNIAQQITGIENQGTMERSYRYDQLQRLKLTANAMVDDNALTVATPSDLYKSTYAYDPDGNITKLSRWDGAGVRFDNFGYNYDDSGTNNKLLNVVDSITSSPSNYTDIKSGQPSDNYKYDAIGNLTKDRQGHLQEITWNLAGKVSSITDSVANKHIFFDYDGSGNRIYKEVVTDLGSPGENHQGEYYLRDAGGNILATYRTSKVYKGTILALNRAMLAGDSTAYYQFLNGDVAPLTGFKSEMLNDAVNDYSGWVDTVIGLKSPSYYFGFVGAWENTMLGSTDTWIDSLRDFESANSISIYGNALSMAAQANDPRLLDWINQIVGAGKAELISLMTDFAAQTSPIDVASLWGMPAYSVSPIYGSSSADGANFGNTVYPAPPNLGNDIMNQLSGSLTATTNFLTAIVADNSIWNSTNIRGINPSWQMDLTGIITDYANKGYVGNFYDNYWISASDWLNQNTTAQDRIAIIYDDVTSGLVASFSHRAGDSSFADVIGSVSGMNVPYYQSVIAGSPSGIVVYTGPADTVGLSEHHLYGSSRIGMQTYSWDGPLKSVWREHLGLVNDTLNHKTVWYSYAYGDLIDSNEREPWAHGDLSVGLKVNRTVGLRYYELSDHLGNVLATVLDRKTGHLPSTPGIGNYDYWKADIASAQDYYPFGMEMPGRTYSASIGLLSKFGFNGQMKTDEIAGMGNSLDFGARIYSSRLGRWLSVDPLIQKYPMHSPYNFCANNPILFLDLDGQDWFVYAKTGTVLYVLDSRRLDQETIKCISGKNLDPNDFERLGPNDMFGSKVLNSHNENILDKGFAIVGNSEDFMKSRGYESAVRIKVRENLYTSGGSMGGEERISLSNSEITQIGLGKITYVKPDQVNKKDNLDDKTTSSRYSSIRTVTYDLTKKLGHDLKETAEIYENRSSSVSSQDAGTGQAGVDVLKEVGKALKRIKK